MKIIQVTDKVLHRKDKVTAYFEVGIFKVGDEHYAGRLLWQSSPNYFSDYMFYLYSYVKSVDIPKLVDYIANEYTSAKVLTKKEVEKLKIELL